MKKRNILITSLFSLFLLAGLGACRHGHHGGFDEFDLKAATDRIASRLDLTNSQKIDLEEIISDVTARAGEMHADREARHQELADLVRQETISRETVDQKVSEKFNRMKDLVDYAADRLIAFHATLTPEQREKVAEHIENHAEKRRCFFRR